MRTRKGHYTTEQSDLYWNFIPRYYGDGYIKAKVTLYYKKGKYKGWVVEAKNYKIKDKDITHWKPYNFSEMRK